MQYLLVARTQFEKLIPLASIFSGVRGILKFTRAIGQQLSSSAHISILNDLIPPSVAASLLESPLGAARGSSTSFPAVTKVDGLPPAPSDS